MKKLRQQIGLSLVELAVVLAITALITVPLTAIFRAQLRIPAKIAGEVSATVKGTSVIPAIISPVPFIARTQAAACKGLARELQSFIVGSDSL